MGTLKMDFLEVLRVKWVIWLVRRAEVLSMLKVDRQR